MNPIIQPLDKITGTFSYQHRAALTGIDFTIWTSEDLETWTEDTGAIQTPDDVVDSIESVSVTLSEDKPLTAPNHFVRVKAE